MVKYVKRPKAKKMFRTFVNRMHLKLPLDVETRRNSTLYLLRGAYASRKDLARFLELKGTAFIKKRIANDQEWEQVRVMTELLAPFDKASIDCCAAKSATLHVGKQSFITLKQHLRMFKMKHITVRLLYFLRQNFTVKYCNVYTIHRILCNTLCNVYCIYSDL